MVKISVILFCVCIPALLFAETKVDPMFNVLKNGSVAGVSDFAASIVSSKSTTGSSFVKVMIKTTDVSALSEIIREMDGKINTALKSVVTAEVPFDKLNELSKLDYVTYIEAAKPMFTKMDEARDEGITNVVPVQAGTGLEKAYNGEGVIVGIYDSGVDCSHEDFKSDGTSRIVAYWDIASGTNYTAEQINAGDCSDSDGHGTHVAGIAASGNSTYKGVAAQASVAVAELNAGDSTEVVNAISYLFRKAQLGLQPIVVNLSLGTSLGPHDGTSVFETGINETLSGKVGRSIVNAAGNERVNTFDDAEEGGYLGGIHGAINVAAGETKAFDWIIRTRTLPTGSFVGFSIADIWMVEGSSDCTVEVDIYAIDNKNAILGEGTAVSAGESSEDDPAEVGSISAYVDFTDNQSADSTNYKLHAQAYVEYTATGSNPTNFSYDVIFRGGETGCSGHVWTWPDFTAHTLFRKDKFTVNGVDGYHYINGDSESTITIPGTAADVITVASFSSRDTWIDIDGATQHEDEYDSAGNGTGTEATGSSLFSSKGPGTSTVNTEKPDITAPGEPIISTLTNSVSVSNRAILGDSTHWKLQGTSMSSPFVAGVVALLFEKNGCLTPAQIKTAITSTAKEENFSIPSEGFIDYEWGYGKVDALAAINAVEPLDCHPDNPSDNPSTKAGCSLIIRDR